MSETLNWKDYSKEHSRLKSTLSLYVPRPEMIEKGGMVQSVKPRGAEEELEVKFDEEFVKYKIAFMLYSCNAKQDTASEILNEIENEYTDLYSDIDDEREEQILKQIRKLNLSKEELKELSEKI